MALFDVEIGRLKGAWSSNGKGWCILCQQEKPLNDGEGWGAASMDSKPYDGDQFCPDCMAMLERSDREEVIAHIEPIFQRLSDTFDEHEDEHSLEFLGGVRDGQIDLILK